MPHSTRLGAHRSLSLELLAWVLVMATLLSACVRRGARSYGDDSLEVSPAPPAAEAETDKQPPTTAGSTGASGGTGVMVLTIRDQAGGKPEGIPVKVEGPLSTTYTSNSSGQIRLEGPAGYYTFQVQIGCFERIEVLAGGSGRGGIAAGQTGRGEVSVQWRHRIAPSLPVFADIAPYWPPGETVTIRFDVCDRCVEGQPRIPGAVYPTWIFQPGDNLRIVANPVMKADGNGFGYVKVTCLREGEAVLSVVDSKNLKDRLDLAATESSGQGQEPSCKKVD